MNTWLAYNAGVACVRAEVLVDADPRDDHSGEHEEIRQPADARLAAARVARPDELVVAAQSAERASVALTLPRLAMI
jgi:hypothetical protein